jgi:hypothetical protein
MRSLVLAVVAVVAIARPARAEEPQSVGGECAAVLCDSRTKHPMEQFPCGTPECVCNDSCDGSSGTSNQGNKALAEGVGKLIAYTVLGVGFVFMPGHMAEATTKDKPKQTVKEARRAWSEHVDQRNKLVVAGKDAEKARAVMWKLDEDERKQLRDAPISKPVKPKIPFAKPKLKPDLNTRCSEAKRMLTTTHSDGPFASFADEEDMRTQCKGHYPDPETPDPTCSATASYRCPAAPNVCCPRSSPIFNPCDGMCYREFDYRGSPNDQGRHCGEAPSCLSN